MLKIYYICRAIKKVIDTMKFIYLLVLTLLLPACGSKQGHKENQLGDDVVIIIEMPMNQNDYITPTGAILKNICAGSISYIEDGRIVSFIPNKVPDTLIIKSKLPYVEISFPYQNVEDT